MVSGKDFDKKINMRDVSLLVTNGTREFYLQCNVIY